MKNKGLLKIFANGAFVILRIQEEIEQAVELDQTVISRQIENNMQIVSRNQMHKIAMNHESDFIPPLYNIWTKSVKTNKIAENANLQEAYRDKTSTRTQVNDLSMTCQPLMKTLTVKENINGVLFSACRTYYVTHYGCLQESTDCLLAVYTVYNCLQEEGNMNQKQKIRKQQAELKKIVAEMPVVERAAAIALVNLGNAVAALVTRRDWQTIAEMSAVCNEIFEGARLLQIEERFYTVQ